MAGMRWVVFGLLLCAPAFAQGEEDDDRETEITISGEGALDGRFGILVDPFAEEQPEVDEPNRPEPVEVGVWTPSALDEAGRAALERLLAAGRAQPDDPAHGYRLAEFYLDHGWLPQAEAEFLRCAALEPDSIRPWDGLLRVYRAAASSDELDGMTIIVFAGGGQVRVDRRRGVRDTWITQRESEKRITRAYLEILRRRPDDVARRQELLAHLRRTGDDRAVAEQARLILERMPGDADTRYELAEAVRRLGVRVQFEEQGLGTPQWTEAVALLEENLQRFPAHVRSALRLARMLAHEKGQAAEERIVALEERAFFHLFVRDDLTDVPFSGESLRLARALAGKSLANALWDEAMDPGTDEDWGFWQPDRRFYTRWIYLVFPHTLPRERSDALESLVRRADASMAGMLISFLWHHREVDDPDMVADRETSARLTDQALRGAIRVGPACYPAAERFLRAADTAARRQRAVRLVRGLEDPRAIGSLVEALAWDDDEDVAYGVAAALEELGDPRAVDGLVEAALDVRRPAARRREAIEALAAFRDPRSVEVMARLAGDLEFGLVSAYGRYRLTGDGKDLRRLGKALVEGAQPEDALRLLAKCGNGPVTSILLEALGRVPPDLRTTILGLLRERDWEASRPRLLAFFLAEADQPGVPPETIRMLGELGGEEAAGRLLALLERLQDERWEVAARALAETGDPRGLRFFSRLRVLSRDESRRALAQELHEIAASRQAAGAGRRNG